MNSRAVETLMGTLVVIVAAGFLLFAYSATGQGRVNGYKIAAEFDRIDGVSVGTDVRVSGIKVGSVVEQKLDPTNFFARVVMSIDPNVKLPDDSSVKVALDGLLGGAYLSIEPGGSEKLIADGGMIQHTQPSIDVVGLLGQAVFSPSSGGTQAEPKEEPKQ